MFRKLGLTTLLLCVTFLGLTGQALAATNRPDGYTTICKIDETCTVSQSTNVAFGAAGLFVYKVLNGTFVCNVATFGSDPNPAKSVKECSVPSGSSSGSSSSGSSSSSSSGSTGAISSGRYAIISRHSGLALDVAGVSTADGANVQQWGYGGGQNQQFDVSNLGNGYFSIRPVHSGKSLDVWEWSTEPGGEIRQYTYAGGDNQQWAISSVGSGYYTITSKFSGLALDVWEWSTAAGGDIRQWTATGGYNQQWQFQSVSSSGSSSSSSSGSGSSSSGGKGSSCSSTGSVSISSTVYVTSGTYDGGCRTYNPTSALGDGSQDESQDPAFRVENGATLRNVIIGNNGVDGIHLYNGGRLENIRWTNVGEDAMTVKSEGNVTLTNVEGYDGEDKFLQINAVTNLSVSNCIVDNMGKFLRQNGGKTFEMSVTVDNCDISNMKEGIFRSDSPNATAHISNSRLRNAGDVCIGSWKSCTSSNLSSF